MRKDYKQVNLQYARWLNWWCIDHNNDQWKLSFRKIFNHNHMIIKLIVETKELGNNL